MIDDLHDLSAFDTMLTRITKMSKRSTRSTRSPRSPWTTRAINGERSLLLLSIPKCGTTWLRYLITNYARQLVEPGGRRVAYRELGYLTSERERVRRGKGQVHPGEPLLSPHGIDHLLYQHPLRRHLATDVLEHAGPKLLVYRNPLDFIVSCYYFYFVYRRDRREEVAHPRDLIAGYTRYWATCWRFLTEVVLPSGRAELIGYDRLKADTEAELTRAFAGLGISLDPEAVRRAIPLSAAERARSDEQNRGGSIVARLDGGSFVRDGSVGQWRDYFADGDVTEVAGVLEACSVDPASVLPAEAFRSPTRPGRR